LKSLTDFNKRKKELFKNFGGIGKIEEMLVEASIPKADVKEEQT